MKKIYLIITGALLCAGVSQAQTSQETMTLDEAIRLTMDGNETLKALEEEKMAAKRQRQATIGFFMPKVNIKGGYLWMERDMDINLNKAKDVVAKGANSILEHAMADPKIGPAIEPFLPLIQKGLTDLFAPRWGITLQDQSTAYIGADVELPIFVGGKLIVANKAARLRENEVGLKAERQRASIICELIERYYGYALCLHVIDVRKQVLDGMQKHLNDVKSLEKNGMVSRTERMYVEYKYAEAQRELMNAQMQAETISTALCSTLGVEKAKLPISEMFILDNLESLAAFKDQAQAGNHILEQVDIARQLAHQNVNLHRADFFPHIAAVGGGNLYNYQLTNMLPRWAVGVAFNFKIFDGLTREFKYSAAKHTLHRVENMQTKAKKDIGVLVENLYSKMVNYRNQVRSIDASVAFAEDYLHAKDSAYKEGIGSATDLVDAEMNLAKSRIERMQAAYNFDVALAKLLETVGSSQEFVKYSTRPDAVVVTFSK
ncbi:MAG: TolC family protein [Alistipes sp.]|nr:TolC family protein [Candidatus Alistipes equi]